MATFTEIKDFRLEISDPENCIDIISVASPANLPANPKQNTVYYIASTGAYVRTLVETCAISTDYSHVDLNLSDTRIGAWIDAYGAQEALVYGINAIIKRLAGKIPLVRMQSGQESTEFQALLSLYQYYKGILSDLKKDVEVVTLNSTGRYGTMTQPEIGGGNL